MLKCPFLVNHIRAGSFIVVRIPFVIFVANESILITVPFTLWILIFVHNYFNQATEIEVILKIEFGVVKNNFYYGCMLMIFNDTRIITHVFSYVAFSPLEDILNRLTYLVLQYHVDVFLILP